MDQISSVLKYAFKRSETLTSIEIKKKKEQLTTKINRVYLNFVGNTSN